MCSANVESRSIKHRSIESLEESLRKLSFSSCPGLCLHDSGELGLPLVAILDELLLVVEELLVEEGSVLKVWSLDDSIDWAGLLAESTENALGHIDVVLGGTARAVWSWL